VNLFGGEGSSWCRVRINQTRQMIVDSFLAYQIILVVCSNGQGLDYEARLQGKKTLSRAPKIHTNRKK
jgi:hypothetical protein